MMTLEIDQATEDRLRDQARRRGLSVERYAKILLDVMARTSPDLSDRRIPFYVSATDEEWEKEFGEWIESQDQSTPPIPDEALLRENLYGD